MAGWRHGSRNLPRELASWSASRIKEHRREVCQPLWYTSSNKTPPPNPLKDSANWGQVFKHVSLWVPFSFKHQTSPECVIFIWWESSGPLGTMDYILNCYNPLHPLCCRILEPVPFLCIWRNYPSVMLQVSSHQALALICIRALPTDGHTVWFRFSVEPS